MCLIACVCVYVCVYSMCRSGHHVLVSEWHVQSKLHKGASHSFLSSNVALLSVPCVAWRLIHMCYPNGLYRVVTQGTGQANKESICISKKIAAVGAKVEVLATWAHSFFHTLSYLFLPLAIFLSKKNFVLPLSSHHGGNIPSGEAQTRKRKSRPAKQSGR